MNVFGSQRRLAHFLWEASTQTQPSHFGTLLQHARLLAYYWHFLIFLAVLCCHGIDERSSLPALFAILCHMNFSGSLSLLSFSRTGKSFESFSVIQLSCVQIMCFDARVKCTANSQPRR